jgi:Bacterial extracellular solute-binding protein/von Willebrand factor type A domain
MYAMNEAAPAAPGDQPDPSPPSPPARRRSRLREPAVLWLAALLVVVLVAWGSVVGLGAILHGRGCDQPATVRVAAAPAVAEAVAEVARTVKPSECYEVEVLSRDSAAMADALANPPAEPLPDAWVPESTFWLRRARSRGAFQAPESGTSIASTPVVLALTEPEAAQLGWPARQVPWSALLGPSGRTVPVGIPDPASDPVGVSALVAIRGMVRTAAEDVAALRRVSPYAVTRASDLYQRLPEAGGTRNTLNAFITSEQALVRYNTRAEPVTPLVASYPRRALPTLDFPYVVLPNATGAARTGATRFLASLLSAAAQPAFGAQGFRGVDGRVLPGVLPDAGARDQTIPPVPLPDENALLDLLNVWTGVHLSAQLLGVIDVSGSMADPLPGGTETKLSATIKAAQQGAGLLLDSTQVSLWVFATQLDGDRDYRVIRPYTSLADGGRGALVDALGQVRVKQNGNTGLYDTVLAAYQAARRAWTPGRINVILIATDGKNDDPTGGIDRARLLSSLRKLQDPRRPLPILFIGLSGGIDPKELQDIAGATSGKVYVTRNPSGIRQIFFDALAGMACQPPACRR